MLCSGCDKWIHKKCASLTKEQYHKLQSEGMIPFCNVSNGDLKKILPSSKSNEMRSKNITATIENKQKNIHCPVCYKKNVKHDLNYSSCNLLIYKKCSRLSQREILDLKKASRSRWECSACLTIKFAFVYLSDEDIQIISFNCSFPCKFQKTLPSDINQPRF